MDDEFAEDVRTHGWAAAGAPGVRPPFLYTIGLLHTFRHPELIMYGLDADSVHALFATLVGDIRNGGSYAEPGVRTVTVGGVTHEVGFRRVHPAHHPRLGFAVGYCQRAGLDREFEAVQAFWPDNWGTFPFDDGCDTAVRLLQPRLDVEPPPEV